MHSPKRETTVDRALAALAAVGCAAYALLFFDKGLNTFDEGWIVLSAERIASGEVPYRDFLLQVNPGVYWTLALVYRLFGPSLIAGRLLAVLVAAATAALIFGVGRATGGSRRAALAAAACFAFWSTNHFNVFWYTWVTSLCVLAAARLLARRLAGGSRLAAAAAGAVAGAAFVAKQNVGAALVVALVLALVVDARLAGRTIRETILDVGAVGAGALVFVAPMFAALGAAGALGAWYFDTVVFARSYLAENFVADPFSILFMAPAALALAGDVAALYLLGGTAAWRATPRRALGTMLGLAALAALHCALPSLAEAGAPLKTNYFRGGPFEVFVATATELVLRALPVLLAAGAAWTIACDARRRAGSAAASEGEAEARPPAPGGDERSYLACAVLTVACAYASVVTYADPVHMLTGCAPVWALMPRFAARARAALDRLCARAEAALRPAAGAEAPLAPTAPDDPDGRLAGLVLALAVAAVAVAGHTVARDAYVQLYAGAAPLALDTAPLAAERGRGVRTDAAQAAAVDGVVAYLGERTAPGEPVFFFPNEPALYFLAARPNPTPYNSFYRDSFVAGDAARVVEALRARGVRYACVRVPRASAGPYDPLTSYHEAAEPIARYLAENYRLEARFGDYLVLRAAAGAAPGL